MKKTLLLTICLLQSAFFIAQPTLHWARGMGGNSDDYGNCITTDANGNVYTAGYFSNTVDFDPGVGSYTLNSGLSIAAFISKLDASGNFVWARAISGLIDVKINSISLDASGNVYTTGNYGQIADFDPGIATYTLFAVGANDIFISKLDASGNFIWAKTMGGSGQDYGNAIKLDGSGNIYTTGYFTGSVDFDPSASSSSLTSAGSTDIFISKLDASGNFVWSKAMGGVSTDEARSLTVDGSGNVYTTGYFRSTADFDPGAGTFTLSAAVPDVFVSKLDASGAFVWAKAMGGSGADYGNAIAVDGSGNVYTTGTHLSGDFDPGPGGFTLTAVGNTDVFVSKLDASGNFVWAKSWGSQNGDNSRSIALDASGNVYTTGDFAALFACDFDPGTGTYTLTTPGGIEDIFISKLDASGNFVWAVNIGGSGGEYGNAISLDASGSIYATGRFLSTPDFDPGPGSYTIASVGTNDAYVLKLNQGPTALKENNEINNLLLFPNPTNSNHLIYLFNNDNEVQIDVVNMNGQLIKSEKTSSNSFSIQDLNPGLYIIQVKEKDKPVKSAKLLIQ